jgi:hypothetical protein
LPTKLQFTHEESINVITFIKSSKLATEAPIRQQKKNLKQHLDQKATAKADF